MREFSTGGDTIDNLPSRAVLLSLTGDERGHTEQPRMEKTEKTDFPKKKKKGRVFSMLKAF